MRRHTAKGVVSSVKLGSEGDGELHIEEKSPSKESRSRQRKRKAEEKMKSDQLVANTKKQKTSIDN